METNENIKRAFVIVELDDGNFYQVAIKQKFAKSFLYQIKEMTNDKALHLFDTPINVKLNNKK